MSYSKTFYFCGEYFCKLVLTTVWPETGNSIARISYFHVQGLGYLANGFVLHSFLQCTWKKTLMRECLVLLVAEMIL